MPLVRKTSAPDQPPAPDAAGLTAPDAGTRWSAARSLGADPQAVPALAKTLAAEPDPRVREAIFTSLARINTQAGFAAAVAELRQNDAQRRGQALEAMLLMPGLALANLDTLLRDEDTGIRILACELARPMAAPEAAASLARLLIREENENVCAAALEILAETGGAAELPAIEHCAVRFPAAPFLGFAAGITAGRIRARLAAVRA